MFVFLPAVFFWHWLLVKTKALLALFVLLQTQGESHCIGVIFLGLTFLQSTEIRLLGVLQPILENSLTCRVASYARFQRQHDNMTTSHPAGLCVVCNGVVPGSCVKREIF